MSTPSFPLSSAQRRLWFLDQLSPGVPHYNIPLVFDIEGPLNPEVLQRALEELTRRHEPLRTVFHAQNGEPFQQVLPHQPFDLGSEDWSQLAPDDRAARLEPFLEHEVRQPFDLMRGPVFRATLVRLDATHHVLAAFIHHICFDGWSGGVMFRELAALYGAFVAGAPSPLPELRLRYTDFAVQEQAWLKTPACAKQLAYWREQLREPRPMLSLPTDRPRAAEQTHKGQRADGFLPDAVWLRLRELSRLERVTPFMLFCAAYSVLLSRLSGSDDVIIGSPIANRNRQELEPLVGFFINTVALRFDLSGRPTFRELLARIKRVAIDAYANQEVPFDRLVDEINPERSLGQMPIIQTLLVVDSELTGSTWLASADVVMRRRVVPTGAVKLDLLVRVLRAQTGRPLYVDYSTDLFDPRTGERLVNQFCHLLEHVVEHVDDRIDRLPIASAAECRRAALASNRTELPAPFDRTLVDLFTAQVRLTPDADAVLCGDERVSYAALEERADRIAAALRQRGIGVEDRVGVCLHRTPDLIAAVLGVLKAGAAYVPLDPAYPLERLRFVETDAGCRVILTQRTLARHTGTMSAARLFIEEIVAPPPAVRAYQGATPSSLAYVIYTSGSTGSPKGVAIEHRQVVNLVTWALTTFAPDDRAGMLASTSMSFDLSVFEWFVPLCSGGTVILVENLLALPRDPARSRVTFVNSVPSVVRELLRTSSLPVGVAVVAMAGEPLHPSLVAQVYAQPGVKKVYDLYGPTETTVYSTCALRTTNGPANIGRPIANTIALVLDVQQEIVPVGVPGELFIGGAGVGRGYLDRDDLTRDRFLNDPARGLPCGRMYRTGDCVRWRSDGTLEYLGRIDRQLKVRGFRIEPVEVEAALLSYPAVADAVVMKREVAPDEAELLAIIVERQACDVHSLYAHLEQRLPRHMVPSRIARVSAVPRLPNGKIDSAALNRAAEAAIADPVVGAVAPPRTATERALVEIWRRVLNQKAVGVDDGFFRIGGNSLLAAQLTFAINQRFGVTFDLAEVFRTPTLAGQARLVEQTPGTEVEHVIAPEGRKGLEWAGQYAAYPSEAAVSRLFETQAAETPSAPAIVDARGPLSYGRLNERANQLGHFLHARLAAIDDARVSPTVGICLSRSTDAVVAMLAALKASAAYVPLDPTLPSARLATLVAKAELSCVIAESRYRGLFSDAVVVIEIDGGESAIAAAPTTNLAEGPGARSLAYVLFTSGTTGDPKAVGVPHRAIVRLAWGMPDIPLGDGQTVLQLAPLSFDASTFEIWCPLLRGGCVAIAPDDLLSSGALGSFLKTRQVGVIWLTASLFNAIVDDDPRALESVSCVLTGGEVLSVPHVRRALEMLPGVRLFNGYGPTETTTFACIHPIDGSELADAGSVPIGRPLLNSRVYVLDDSRRLTPPGEPGELWIGGDGVGIGYLNDPALTAERFIPDPFVDQPDARIYRSGDRVRWRSDGTMEFLGRLDDQIKIRGFRIEPGEVEAAIAVHPAVQRVAVVAVDLPGIGRALSAFVVFKGEVSASDREQLVKAGLRDALRARVPTYMIPARWTALGALPLLPTGKIDRRALTPGGSIDRLGSARQHPGQAVAPVSLAEGLPLSYSQQRIWFLQRWYDGEAVYNVPFALKIEGPLDVDRLRFALQTIIDRHSALRTTFPVREDVPVQHVAERLSLAMPLVELSDLDRATAELRAGDLATEEAARPFDLATAPLVRATLLRLAPHTSVLLLTFHHIVVDGWSIGILWRELGALYRSGGIEAAALPAPAVGYADFAVWQRQYLTGPVLERLATYWQRQLRPPVAELAWPLARPYPEQTTLRGGHVPVALGLETSSALTQLAGTEGVTVFMVLLAAFQAVLHRYVGQDDILVGSPIANRTRPELDNVIGCFINTLVLRGDLSGNPTFRQLLSRTRQLAVDAQAHQDLPFELLVDLMKVKRSANRSPLFQAMLVLNDGLATPPVLEGLAVSPFPFRVDTAKFELMLVLRTHGDGLRGSFRYNADLFEPAMASDIASDFATVLCELIDQPDRRIDDLPLRGADTWRARARAHHPTVAEPEPTPATPVTRVAGIEPQLAALWQTVLQIPSIEPDDNFFDLGGHSLLAVRLLTEVEKKFGVRLPLSTLFRNATIRDQARLLVTPAAQANAWSVVVPIQPHGNRPPFFLVHGIGGEVLSFDRLAHHLGTDQPVFGLQAEHDVDSVDDRLEAVAARYVTAMQDKRPHGPYYLGGYSSGGILAYEMAQQLLVAGEEVAALVMLDTAAPRVNSDTFTPQTLWRLVKNAAYWTLDDEFLRSDWASQRARVTSKLRAIRARSSRTGRIAAMEAGADVRDLLGLWRVPERARRFLERYVRMMVSYQPRPYAGTVTLLRARTRSLTYTGDSDLGWSKLATGVSVHSVPGAHDTILKEPRVRDLAAALSAQLERASLRRNGAAVTGRSLRD